MMGPERNKDILGIYALASRDIFELLEKPENAHLQVYVSFFEIYGGKLFDLLNNRKKLVSRDDAKQNVHIVGLQEVVVQTCEEMMQIIDFGNVARSTGTTTANAGSS